MTACAPQESRVGRACVLLVIAWLASACCLVRPPHAEEILESGFGSPEQTFRTFRTAFAADLPDLEYRSFSLDYLARNRISQALYREYRARLLESQPWLVSFASAELDGEGEEIGVGRHRLFAKVVGRRIAIELVREDLWQMWQDGEFLADGDLAFDRAAQIDPQGVVSASFAVDPYDYPAEMLEGFTELRLAREWKIDNIYEPDENVQP